MERSTSMVLDVPRRVDDVDAVIFQLVEIARL